MKFYSFQIVIEREQASDGGHDRRRRIGGGAGSVGGAGLLHHALHPVPGRTAALPIHGSITTTDFRTRGHTHWIQKREFGATANI